MCSYTFIEAQSFPNFETLDVECQFFEIKWIFHNELSRTTLIPCSDKQEISLSEHCWNGYQWSFRTKTDLNKEEYKNLVDHLPTFISYEENYK